MKQIVLLLIIFISCSPKTNELTQKAKNNELVLLSKEIVRNGIKSDYSTFIYIEKELQSYAIDEVAQILKEDNDKLAFWINIYNGYIQYTLRKNPKLYDDRSNFFKEKRITLFGLKLSFEDIEHGILRKSQNPLGLGYLRKVFVPGWERKLRVDQRDYRIHFALNCGAKDCPPVVIYSAENLKSELNGSTENYLSKTTTYQNQKNMVEVTSLFSWFRGDFGGKRGTKIILSEYDLIPEDSNPTLVYSPYDWTLDLENYILE